MMAVARSLAACVVRWIPSWSMSCLFSSMNCVEMMLLGWRSSRMVLSLMICLSSYLCFLWSRL